MSETIQVKERGILFQPLMIHSIGKAENPKQLTSRLKGLEKVNEYPDRWSLWYPELDEPGTATFTDNPLQGEKGTVLHLTCPYGRPGDRLWCKESWRVGSEDRNTIWYRDNGVLVLPDSADNLAGKFLGNGWHSPLFMYRWASRYLLEITSVKAARLQNISMKEVLMEGAGDIPDHGKYFLNGSYLVGSFAHLWDSINGKKGHGWARNDYVWRIGFRRLA